MNPASAGPLLPAPPHQAPGVPDTAIHRPADVNVMLKSEVLNFGTGSAAISKVSALKVQQTALLFKRYLNQIEKVDIVGQTDQQGPAGFNQTLSERRAGVVVSILKRMGLPSEVLKFEGVGAAKVSSCASSKRCSEDRIVVIKVDLKSSLTPSERAAFVRRINLVLGIVWLGH
jgi:outer membrane protein OmpA-like peptidoglycan-associated protein